MDDQILTSVLNQMRAELKRLAWDAWNAYASDILEISVDGSLSGSDVQDIMLDKMITYLEDERSPYVSEWKSLSFEEKTSILAEVFPDDEIFG